MVWRLKSVTVAAGEYGLFHNFWEAPHRPLFSAAILCALLIVAWWPLGAWLGLPNPAFEPVVLWHVHELVFGFAAAAMGGYLLTALPSWTGKPPVRGNVLKMLLMFWLCARLAIALVPDAQFALLVVFNSGYFLLLSGIVGYQLFLARAFHKLGFLFAVAALGTAEVLFLGTALIGVSWLSLTFGLTSLIGLVMLMVGIGMRAVPAFTNNWLVQNSREARLCQSSTLALLLTQMLLATTLVAKLADQHNIASVAMICAALIMLWHMRGWQSLSVFPNPLLVALHISFLWLPLGLVAVGVSGLVPAIYPMTDALHAITIGGMSGLIMAISGRAAAHTDSGDMQANSGLVVAFLLIWIATFIRLAVPIFPGSPVVILTASIWCVAWVAFAIGFLPALTKPLRRPVLSGRRSGALAEVRNAERKEQ